MTEAFICDVIRTPFGRYGGALSPVRTDDLAAIPIKALLERNPGLDPAAVDDVILGCANQAGEDNRNVARMALLLAGLPQEVPGSTREPPLRIEPGRNCHCSACHQDRRELADHRRRRGEHVALAVCDGQVRIAVLARPQGRRHHAGLALRESEDEGDVRCRLDGRDGGERCRGVPYLARGPGRLRLSQPAARGRGDAEWRSGGRDRAGVYPTT